jgi:protein-tyrosine phosphatase
VVSSAGLLEGGAPATSEAVEVAAALGLDTSSHRSRAMTADAIEAAGIVIGLAKQHVQEALIMLPQAWPKTFTLKELVRRGEAIGPRESGLSVGEWLEKVHAGRSRADLLGRSTDDDVADPIGRGRPAYEKMAAELESLVTRLIDLVWPDGGGR